MNINMKNDEMKKYKQNRKLSTFICVNCGEEATKPTTELNRNTRLGRNNFCSRSCVGKYRNANDESFGGSEYKNSDANKEHLKKIAGNRRDEFTPFRYTLRNAKKRFHDFDLDLQYLKDLFESQKGLCIYSKVELQLPEYKNTIADIRFRASLDRIDSSLGYIPGNVQWVSTSINYLKAQMSHEEVIEFLKITSDNLSFDKDQTISSPQDEVSDALAGN